MLYNCPGQNIKKTLLLFTKKVSFALFWLTNCTMTNVVYMSYTSVLNRSS